VSEAVAAPEPEGDSVDAVEESHEEESLADEEAEAPRSFVLPRLPRPKLSVKERKELASYAHGLGKKLKSQQVGKGGVTPNLVSAFSDNLESNELLKVDGPSAPSLIVKSMVDLVLPARNLRVELLILYILKNHFLRYACE
jgi:hypothetical protein